MFDKLRDRNVGRCFTTFRGYTPSKDRYYSSLIDKRIPTELSKPKGRFLGRAHLTGLSYSWSNDLPLSFIKSDTYEHYEISDWIKLMQKFYGHTPVYGIILNLMWTDVVE